MASPSWGAGRGSVAALPVHAVSANTAPPAVRRRGPASNVALQAVATTCSSRTRCCNSDTSQVSETERTTNRDGVAILQDVDAARRLHFALAAALDLIKIVKVDHHEHEIVAGLGVAKHRAAVQVDTRALAAGGQRKL